MVRHIAGYEIIAAVGQGAMATVYRARASDPDRAAADEVAIKLLRPEYLTDLGFRARFEREGALIMTLAHEAIVPVYSFGQAESQLYIIMAYMRHGTLSQRQLYKRPSVEEALEILTRVSAALDYAHQRGVVHRDLKPSNVLFNFRDEAFLADFGIAHELQEGAAGVETISGTPAYMSPEQARREKTAGVASDIYALGIMAFELLTGVLPFRAASPIAVLVQQMEEAPAPPSSLNGALPERVDSVLQRALAKEAAARYESAGAFVAALREALGGEGAEDTAAIEVAQTVTAVEATGPTGDDEPAIEAGPEGGAEVDTVAVSDTLAWLMDGRSRQMHTVERFTIGFRTLWRAFRARPPMAFAFVTFFAVVLACVAVGALRGVELAAALRGESPSAAEGTGGSPTAMVYLPFTSAEVDEVPAQPTVTAAPTAAVNLRLLVSRDVVTLLNVAGTPLSLRGMTLQRVTDDGEVRAAFGLDGLRRVAGNAIDALPGGDCLQVWRTDALAGRGPEKPGDCDTLRGWLATRQTNPLFQGMEEGDSFALIRGEQQMVRCAPVEESCAFLLTQE